MTQILSRDRASKFPGAVQLVESAWHYSRPPRLGAMGAITVFSLDLITEIPFLGRA